MCTRLSYANTGAPKLVVVAAAANAFELAVTMCCCCCEGVGVSLTPIIGGGTQFGATVYMNIIAVGRSVRDTRRLGE